MLWKKYVLHISALKFYLQHGLKLKKAHRAISFDQAHFLKPFIEFNTEKRKQANNDFEKDLFKLVNNSVYGKTMENIRKHGDFELVNTAERFQKLVNKPTYKHRHIINDELVIVEKDKQTIELNKPIYMGMSIYSLRHAAGHQLEPARLVAMARACVAVCSYCVFLCAGYAKVS